MFFTNYNHVGILATVKSSPKEVDILLDKYNVIHTKKSSTQDYSVIEMEDLELPLSPLAEVLENISDKVDQFRASLIPHASRLVCGAIIAHFIGLRIFYFSILVRIT